MTRTERNWSDDEIAILAERVRAKTKCHPNDRLDVPRLIQEMREDADRTARVAFVPCTDKELPRSRARAESQLRIIRYRQSVMDAAVAGDPEAGEVFLEEIGHMLMHTSSPVLDNAIGVDLRAANREDVRVKEREAEKFIWYCKAPISEVYSATDPSYLVAKFGLSPIAAKAYVEHLRRTRNRIERTGRSLPAFVINFQSEAEKRGYRTRARNGNVAVSEKASTTPNATTHDSTSVIQSGSGFLPESCECCGQRMLRLLGGCRQCMNCGDNQGCD